MENKNYLVYLCLAAAVFASGFFIGKDSVSCKVCAPENIDFSLFWESLNAVNANFINSKDVDTKKIIYGAISGMVKSLGDPYTVFFTPEESKSFLEDTNGEFDGIGIEIGSRKGQLQVISPLEGTPAQQAGLRAGDKILKIGDTYTADLSVDESVKLIRGPKDTEITLTIMRDGWDSAKEITIKRAKILVPSLKWEMKEGDTAYIKIYQFSEKLDQEFRTAANGILNSPAKKIILDLRNNPGGYLQRAQDVAGWFVKIGETVVIEDPGEKGERIIYKAQGNEKLAKYPIVILINQGSASAAEILAAALRDDNGIQLIGENTFGKGSVQQLVNLSDNSSLKVTVAKWLTPKGNLISEIGLKPDIEVKMADEDFQNNKDPQLDKALEVIKNMR